MKKSLSDPNIGDPKCGVEMSPSLAARGADYPPPPETHCPLSDWKLHPPSLGKGHERPQENDDRVTATSNYQMRGLGTPHCYSRTQFPHL